MSLVVRIPRLCEEIDFRSEHTSIKYIVYISVVVVAVLSIISQKKYVVLDTG